MATRTAMASGDDQPFRKPKALEGVLGKWNELTRFLTDVRAEMRKVVAPGWKEVRLTTGVVLVTVFIFGVFFFVTDYVFRNVMNVVLNKLNGM